MSGRDTAEHPDEELQELQVLYVEDNEQTGPLVRDWLERHDDRFSVALAYTLDRAVERIEQDSFDAVVADYRFPEGTGLELLDRVRAADADVPFLLYSARADEAVERAAREAGVDAIVQKGDAGQLAELADRIIAAVEGRLAAEPPEAGGNATDPVEAFAAEVAHDLRGSLSIAYGHLDLLERDDEHVAGLHEALAELEATVDALTTRAAEFEDEE